MYVPDNKKLQFAWTFVCACLCMECVFFSILYLYMKVYEKRCSISIEEKEDVKSIRTSECIIILLLSYADAGHGCARAYNFFLIVKIFVFVLKIYNNLWLKFAACEPCL